MKQLLMFASVLVVACGAPAPEGQGGSGGGGSATGGGLGASGGGTGGGASTAAPDGGVAMGLDAGTASGSGGGGGGNTPPTDAGTSMPDAGTTVADAGTPVVDAGTPRPTPQYPGWTLKDVQPASPRYNQVYGLSAFLGHPVVVTLASSSCPPCVSQANIAESLWTELKGEGRSVVFVLLEDASANLVSGYTMPVFQDPSIPWGALGASATSSWGQMEPGAVMHDTFVFDADGVRVLAWKAGLIPDMTKWRADIAQAVRVLPP